MPVVETSYARRLLILLRIPDDPDVDGKWQETEDGAMPLISNPAPAARGPPEAAADASHRAAPGLDAVDDEGPDVDSAGDGVELRQR